MNGALIPAHQAPQPPTTPLCPAGPYSLVLARLLTQCLPALFGLHTELLALQLLHGGFVFLQQQEGQWLRVGSAHSSQWEASWAQPSSRPPAPLPVHVDPTHLELGLLF